MKKTYLFILACLQIWQVQAQQKSLELENIVRLVFVDSQNWDYRLAYTTEYEVVKENNIWKQYITRQSVIGRSLANKKTPFDNSDERVFVANIPQDTLQKFISIFNNVRVNEPCTLEDFGINQKWIDKFKDTLYYDILKSAHTEEYKKELMKYKEDIMREISSEKHYYNRLIESNSSWTNDYPICAIRIDLVQKDTIHLVTHAQAQKMPTWTMFKKMEDQHNNYDVFCSPAISAWLGNRLLSFEGWSNKKRLLGVGFLLPSVTQSNFTTEVYKKEKGVPILAQTTKLEGEYNIHSPKDSVVHYHAPTLRKWEKEWKVQFLGDTEPYMYIQDSIDGLHINTSIYANHKSEKTLKQLCDTLHKNLLLIKNTVVFQKNKKYIEKITFYKSVPYLNSINRRNYIMTAHFETISDLYNKHSYLYKRGRVPEKKAKPTFFISIAEKQGASSYWVIDENDKFILWKFDAGSIFEELDKNKKAFKRYESDTERILLEWIE